MSKPDVVFQQIPTTSCPSRQSQALEAENSTFEKSSNYLIDDQTRECMDEMKKMFENEKSLKHSMLKIEKHLDKSSEAFSELAKGVFLISNTLKEFLNPKIRLTNIETIKF